ncbi:MAG: hypothetical protein KAW93_07535 [Methanogenium sp.]|nr:hypothetical protein [Methanogenium sp.]
MTINIAFAGDRQISVDILSYLISEGIVPKILIVPDNNASHADKLIKICSKYSDVKILKGKIFKTPNGIKIINAANLDYIISIHFSEIYPNKVLSIPKYGILNLHPAYLPYNRGWHTPTWAIIDETPYGATLHFMNDTVDTGDIIHQKKIDVLPNDTANSLYKRVLQLEYDTFVEAWPWIIKNNYKVKKQKIKYGTSHKKIDIEDIREINLDENIKIKDLINKIRGLTTNKKEENVYFYKDGKKYYLQINIYEENCD